MLPGQYDGADSFTLVLHYDDGRIIPATGWMGNNPNVAHFHAENTAEGIICRGRLDGSIKTGGSGVIACERQSDIIARVRAAVGPDFWFKPTGGQFVGDVLDSAGNKIGSSAAVWRSNRHTPASEVLQKYAGQLGL